MIFWRPTQLPIDPWGTPDTGFATMRVTSPYGPRDGSFHGALDIGNARLGDLVTAIGEGVVILASIQPQIPWNYPAPPDKQQQWKSPSYGGNVIVIDHGNRTFSQYAHLQNMAVWGGQKVAIGQVIGHVGDSGSAAPPPAGGGGHLHFGIRINDQWVDPWPLIQPTGGIPVNEEQTLRPGKVKGEPTPVRVTLPIGTPVYSAPGSSSSPLPYDFGTVVIGVDESGTYAAYVSNTGGLKWVPVSAIQKAEHLYTETEVVQALRQVL